MGGYRQKVITWQHANGRTVSLCSACEDALESNHRWPAGYDTVSESQHRGECDGCEGRLPVPALPAE